MAFVYWIHLPEHTDKFSEGYIGFTSGTVEKRWSGHLIDSKRCPHVILYRALAKHGDRIVVTTLVEGSNEYCLDLENKLRPVNKIGWNIKIGGDVGSIGVIPSEESRKKMSDAHLGHKNHFFGRVHSQDSRDKISNTKIGIPMNDTAKEKLTFNRLHKPWLHRKSQSTWVLAEDIRLSMLKGIKNKSLADLFGVSKDSIKTVIKRISEGWLPLTDTHWIEMCNKQRELSNV